MEGNKELIKQIDKHEREIENLTKEGETRLRNLSREIRDVKNNRLIPKSIKQEIIAKDKELISNAKKNVLLVKKDLKEKRKENYGLICENYSAVLRTEKALRKEKVAKAKKEKADRLFDARMYFDWRKKEIQKEPYKKEEKQQAKERLRAERKEFLLRKEDIIRDYKTVLNQEKERIHAIEMERSLHLQNTYGHSLPLRETVRERSKNYIYKFNLRDFIFNNGLYFVILLTVILLAAYYGANNDGKFLFTFPVILSILEQSAPRLFFSLGVAGLIVLAGTDLSVGRMVGMGGVLTVMFLTTSGIPEISFLGVTPNFSSIPMGIRIILGFLVSILACSFFSCLAGFFTAKFKMHPFISTLANQLMIFGGMVLLTGNGYTGMPNSDVLKGITGRIGEGTTGFPIMIIYAIILIIVMWFIWNKTRFGKNMFAVGGNPEAASVSGISVFWTTMGAFLLAGILYGIGSSIFGIYSTSVKAQNGQGMESDAIAACVVGGVSFSGGVGSIRGVVIGTLLFQAIAYILPFIGIGDSNAQLFIKGLIILVAVTFDCVKFLKKK